jgi:hypothetical protein
MCCVLPRRLALEDAAGYEASLHRSQRYAPTYKHRICLSHHGTIVRNDDNILTGLSYPHQRGTITAIASVSVAALIRTLQCSGRYAHSERGLPTVLHSPPGSVSFMRINLVGCTRLVPDRFLQRRGVTDIHLMKFPVGIRAVNSFPADLHAFAEDVVVREDLAVLL